MTETLIIAVDAMGGDRAPDVIVEGLSLACERLPDFRYLLFGDEQVVAPLVARYRALRNCCEVRHTEKAISGDDKPSFALRHGRDSSMGLAIQAVHAGEAAVAISAGNTGALMALAKFILRTMPGIYRPALVSRIPTTEGESVMLDLGANVECDENSLVQFAIMGAAFSRAVMGCDCPRIGLLNVGVEELKGHERVKAAGQRLRSLEELPLVFAGFIEGGDIAAGMVDVIVTDGFTGNIAIKTAEGTARYMLSLLDKASRKSFATQFGFLLARKELRALREHFKPSTHNGGVFLGLNGLVVKSHGGADANGTAAAVRLAAEMASDDLCGMIKENLDSMEEEGALAGKAAAS